MPPKPPARRGYSMAPAGAPEGVQRRLIAARARTHAKKTSQAWNCGRPSSATISSYDFEALSVFALARHLPAQGCNVTDETDGQQHGAAQVRAVVPRRLLTLRPRQRLAQLRPGRLRRSHLRAEALREED